MFNIILNHVIVLTSCTENSHFSGKFRIAGYRSIQSSLYRIDPGVLLKAKDIAAKMSSLKKKLETWIIVLAGIWGNTCTCISNFLKTKLIFE